MLSLINRCPHCKTIISECNKDGFDVCLSCGYCVPESFVGEYEYDQLFPSVDKDSCNTCRTVRAADVTPTYRFIVRKKLYQTGKSAKYNPLYYCNERRSQFALACPKIPEEPWNAILWEYFDNIEKYGSNVQLLQREDAIEMCKRASYEDLDGSIKKCTKYAERWKLVLWNLGKNFFLPSNDLLLEMAKMDEILEPCIRKKLALMPSSNRKRASQKYNRHNSPNIDYRMRLVLWICCGKETVWDKEFPYLRTKKKRKALDFFFASVCEELGLPFLPSTERDDPPDPDMMTPEDVAKYL